MDLFVNFVTFHVKKGNLNRELECLPSEEAMLERRSAGEGLLRPEISVLVAYSKNLLTDALRESTLIDQPFFADIVMNAFPAQMHDPFRECIREHRLFREIVSTQLSNLVVSEMGPTFVYQMQDEMDISLESVIYAYTVARHVFQLDKISSQLEALDFSVDADVQYSIMSDLTRLIRRSTRWLLRHESQLHDVATLVDRYQSPLADLLIKVPELLVSRNKSYYDKRLDFYLSSGVPVSLAKKAFLSGIMYHAFNVGSVSSQSGSDAVVACDCILAIPNRYN
jgi:NAD-specific glutamate dehydrogenase